jgi:hypothetical protein
MNSSRRDGKIHGCSPVPQNMSQCLAVFLASELAVALQPMPAVGQAACDPSTSYCGGSTGSSQQGQGLQLPNLQSGAEPGIGEDLLGQ